LGEIEACLTRERHTFHLENTRKGRKLAAVGHSYAAGAASKVKLTTAGRLKLNQRKRANDLLLRALDESDVKPGDPRNVILK
jgi:hypothetical protein